MIINCKLEVDKQHNILNQASDYNPNDETLKIRKQVFEDFKHGKQIMDNSYREFNNLTLTQRQSRDQMVFNNFEPDSPDNPDEEWRSTAVRPLTRNRAISVAAHLVGGNLFPKVFAQNENDEEDQASGMVMRDLMEWTANQAGYDKMFLYGVIAALVNPAVIMHIENRKAKRKVKLTMPNGKREETEIDDEVFSGEKISLVPVDELFIENIYEHDIQKQGFLIWRRVIDYSTAQIKYRDSENFKKYVRPGIQIMLGDDQDTFYEQYDEELGERLVEEVVYYNRQIDLEIVFVNGVLVTDPDRANPRKDKRYPFAKTGYELIDEGRFFYYKSLAFKLAPEQDVIDTLYRMVIDGTYLKIMPPLSVIGAENIDAGIIMPGVVTAFENPDTKIEGINTNANLNEGRAMIEKIEDSMNEASQDPLQMGIPRSGSQTAFEISRLEQNARIQLGLFGRMMGFLIQDIGELMANDILQHLTVGDLQQIGSGKEMLKYRTFIIPEKSEKGGTKTIEFKNEEIPKTEEEKKKKGYELLEREGGLESNKQIVQVNPELFRKRKYKFKVSPDIMFPPSENVQRALALEEYDRAIQNPMADQESIYKDLLLGVYDKTKDAPEKYVRKAGQGGLETIDQNLPTESPLQSILGAEGIENREQIGV
ncbi:hypothetical protein GF319_15490 [Candidatus Bathyarchaeota archaeon]|nr:hypothetical protein [Candidatus Bathyarchaeota archaeon]